MQLRTVIRRFLVPAPVVTLYCLIKFGAKVSPKAEVELSPLLTLGKGTQIGSFVKIKATTGPLTIGDNVSVGNTCTILTGAQGIEIGTNTMIGPNVVIVGNNLNYADIEVPIRLQGESSKGVKIGKDCWIGASCVILDGSTIEDGVVVTPLSMVSGRVRRNSILAGNPAKTIFTRR